MYPASSLALPFNTSGYRDSNGRMYFPRPIGRLSVHVINLTTKSGNTSTSEFDKVEANEDFAADGSSNASSQTTLSNDSNDNQITIAYLSERPYKWESIAAEMPAEAFHPLRFRSLNVTGH